MKISTYYNLAIAAMKLEIRKIAYDANMHDLLKWDTPTARNASKHKKELLEAIKFFEEVKGKEDGSKKST